MQSKPPPDGTIHSVMTASGRSRSAKKAAASGTGGRKGGRPKNLPEIVLFDHASVLRERRKQQRRYWRDLREGRMDDGPSEHFSEHFDVVIVNLGDDPFGRR